jgi:hypothetical protein
MTSRLGTGISKSFFYSAGRIYGKYGGSICQILAVNLSTREWKGGVAGFLLNVYLSSPEIVFLNF